jgi:hypothetical protein
VEFKRVAVEIKRVAEYLRRLMMVRPLIMVKRKIIRNLVVLMLIQMLWQRKLLMRFHLMLLTRTYKRPLMRLVKHTENSL